MPCLSTGPNASRHFRAARFAWLLCLLLTGRLAAAIGDDQTFKVTVSVQASPAAVTFTWSPAATAAGTVHRRTLGTLGWSTQIGTIASGATTFTDSAPSAGTRYEYRLLHSSSKYAYVASGVGATLDDQRGKVILLVDQTMATPCAAEIALLIRDLAGDGWQVIRHDVPRDDGNYSTRLQAAAIKDTILADYNADKANTRAVILFGRVPVPYSGNMNPDGHYTRAIPTDGYYADLTGTWSDSSVNNTASGSTRTNNIPGDGKFDQNYFAKQPVVMLGRIDTWNMPAFAGQSEADLLKRYVAKANAWRHKHYLPEAKAVTVTSRDWNWSMFNNVKQLGLTADNTPSVMQALAQRRNTYAYFGNTGGNDNVSGYTTAMMAAQNVNAPFMFEGGSYSVDWDNANSFMRSFIAASGCSLTSGWAEFPGYYIHHMGMGTPIGESIRIMQFATTTDYVEANYNVGFKALYINMMGDPTIRLHRVAPAGGLTASAAGAAVALAWSASPDSGVTGYHVYRGAAIGGAMTRLTASPVATTSYTDSTARSGDVVYMVRAIRLETGTGTYWNASQGVFVPFTGAGGSNALPVAQGQNLSVDEDANLAITLTASDANGDALSYAVASQPANGQLLGSPPNLTYKPYANWFGSDSLTFTASDAHGASQPATIAITVNSVNDRPVAAAYTLKAYAANGGQPSEVVGAATDVEKSPLTFAIASQPAQGSVQLIGGNVLRYIPNGTYTGADSFTYIANDGQDDSTPATVSVTVSAAANPADGLVAYYPFSDAAGSTTTADASGNAKTANLLNGASLDAAGGIFAGALRTTAATQACQVPQLWTTTSGIFDASVAAWFKADDPGNNTRFQVIVEAGTFWTIYVRNSTLYVLWDGQVVSTTGIQSGRWYHVAMTLDSSPYADYYNRVLEANRRTVYLDGAIIARGSYSLTPRLLDAYGIGNLQVSAMFHDKTSAQTIDSWFAGRVDDVRWYGRKLEPSEVYALALAGSSGSPGTLQFSSASSSQGEGNSGTAAVSITVTRSGGSTGAVSVGYATSDGSATAGSDYSATSGTLSWAAGEMGAKTFAVSIIGDAAVEPDETINLTLSAATGGSVLGSPATAAITILNDDAVTNAAPVITEGASTTLTVTEDVAGAKTLNATDANGDTLTWSILTPGTKGVAAASGTGLSKSVTYIPTANLNGSDSFVVQVSDGKGGTDTITVNVTITAVNDAPSFAKGANQTVAEDAVAQTVTGWATAISAGPSDESAQTLTFTATNTNNALFSAQPAIAANGTLTYTPAANATGSATVTVTLADNGGTANGGVAVSAAQTCTITVTAVNDAPVLAAAIPDQTATVGVAFSYVVPVGTFTDVDNASLTWSSNESLGWLSFDAATRTFSGTPAAGDVASTTITVTASDGILSASDAFVLTVNAAANAAPVITEGTSTTLAVTEDVAGAKTLNATDANGDTLTWSILTPGTKGVAAASGTGLAKSVTYTPTANLNGSDSFVVQVSDGKGGTDTITVNVTITAVNDAPSFAKGADQTVAEDAVAQTVTGWATAISAGPSDESAQTLTFTATNTNNALFSAQPAIAANGALTWTPAANASGSATVTVTLADSGGASSAAQTFTITVTAVNDAPVLAAAIPDQTATVGVAFSYVVPVGTFTDVDNASLAWSSNESLGWLSFDAATRTFSGTPALGDIAASSITVTVSDGSLSAADAFVLTVIGNLPAGWTAGDVGAVAATGGSTQSGGIWTIAGSGADIAGTADEFQFASTAVTGDAMITARVDGLSGPNDWSMAGVMIRDGTAAGARHVTTTVSVNKGTHCRRRLTTGGTSATTNGAKGRAPYWVRVERLGNEFISSVSADGTTWKEIRRETIAMGSTVRVGLAVSSRSDGQIATATFSNVVIVAAVPSPN